jgi:IS30 family transposase
MRVSHETLYKSLFIETRNIFHKKLRKHLRTKRKFWQAKAHKVGSRGRIDGGVSIHDRPAEIESRATLGHWEGDLIVGSNNSHIATVVERSTRFTMLVQADSKKTSDVVGSLSKQLSQFPEALRKNPYMGSRYRAGCPCRTHCCNGYGRVLL